MTHKILPPLQKRPDYIPKKNAYDGAIQYKSLAIISHLLFTRCSKIRCKRYFGEHYYHL